MKKIFHALLNRANNSCDTVLVTVISKQGSSPREKGAMMLVDSQGIVVGTIGGGALENRSMHLAQELLSQKTSLTHKYQLHANSGEDIGMVCGGDLTVLFQYIDASDDTWKKLAEEMIHRIEDKISGYLVLQEKSPSCRIVDNTTGPESAGAEGQTFIAPIPIGEQVFLYGAGHCALALCPILHSVGFLVTVLDNRPEMLTEERFPTAEARILCDYENLENCEKPGKEDYAVIMTSGHAYDYVVEKQILQNACAYLGVIGSRRKVASVNERLIRDGIEKSLLDSVHTPIGLPIKAQTPEEIAISIAAEMIYERACRNEAEVVVSSSCPMHTAGA